MTPIPTKAESIASILELARERGQWGFHKAEVAAKLGFETVERRQPILLNDLRSLVTAGILERHWIPDPCAPVGQDGIRYGGTGYSLWRIKLPKETPLYCMVGMASPSPCRNAATCAARYEGERTPVLSCDEHCGHGCEDGRCIVLKDEP